MELVSKLLNELYGTILHCFGHVRVCVYECMHACLAMGRSPAQGITPNVLKDSQCHDKF